METSIRLADLPSSALLRRYVREGTYTDCYCTDVPATISLPRYVETFYTTPVFKLERWILTHLVSKPSTDRDARNVALAQAWSFAAWTVERRTRSWFMVAPITGGTRLYFGSAVVPVRRPSGELTLGSTYRALTGFHKLYSRILLRAARSALGRQSFGAQARQEH